MQSAQNWLYSIFSYKHIQIRWKIKGNEINSLKKVKKSRQMHVFNIKTSTNTKMNSKNSPRKLLRRTKNWSLLKMKIQPKLKRDKKIRVFDEVTTDALVSHFLCTMEKNDWKNISLSLFQWRDKSECNMHGTEEIKKNYVIYIWIKNQNMNSNNELHTQKIYVSPPNGAYKKEEKRDIHRKLHAIFYCSWKRFFFSRERMVGRTTMHCE